MTEEKNTQWHPAFTAAIHMEFVEDKADLDFQTEVTLNTMPLRVDMILIKKKKELSLKNEIGRIFRRYNLIEYKSPKDDLNYDVFLKGIAYAYLFKSYEKHVDKISLSEMTLTFIRENRPVKLLKKLREINLLVEEAASGVYYISGHGEIAIQLIDLDDKYYAGVIWEVVTAENKKLMRRLREDEDMGSALAMLMKPEIDQAFDSGFNNGFGNGKLIQLFELLKKGIITRDVALAETDLSAEEFEAKYKDYLA